ncbi:NUDIX domain protein, partial [Vibrio harveyi]
WSVAQATYY